MHNTASHVPTKNSNPHKSNADFLSTCHFMWNYFDTFSTVFSLTLYSKVAVMITMTMFPNLNVYVLKHKTRFLVLHHVSLNAGKRSFWTKRGRWKLVPYTIIVIIITIDITLFLTLSWHERVEKYLREVATSNKGTYPTTLLP